MNGRLDLFDKMKTRFVEISTLSLFLSLSHAPKPHALSAPTHTCPVHKAVVVWPQLQNCLLGLLVSPEHSRAADVMGLKPQVLPHDHEELTLSVHTIYSPTDRPRHVRTQALHQFLTQVCVCLCKRACVYVHTVCVCGAIMCVCVCVFVHACARVRVFVSEWVWVGVKTQ